MRVERQNVKILNINISKLFGYKEINIDIPPDDNLVVFYGDNGSGKTTVLDLLNHIFSPVPKGGHRTNIGKIIFQSISITLSNKIEIVLKRDEPKAGTYNLIIKNSNEEIVNWHWFSSEHPEYSDENIEYKKYCDLMNKLNFSIFYLPANRRVDKSDEDKDETIIIQDSEGIRHRILRQENKASLNRELRQFQQWLRREMIKRTNVGYRNINDLYNVIINEVIDKKITDDVSSKENIINRIAEMESRNNGFKKYGLSENFLKDDIIKTLRNVGDNEFAQILTVLNPYLKSINLRLDSLEELQLLLSKFEENINCLFNEKSIFVSVEEGIKIKSLNNSELALQNLSSGEKQLLLIFCNVITSWSNSRIIIIDEPEISLNVKWQRLFIGSILDIIDKRNTQLFIATHSIEMLSKYTNNIHKLGKSNEQS